MEKRFMESKDKKGDMPKVSTSLQLTKAPRFALGWIVMTQGAMNAFVEALVTPEDLLERHSGGDWGDVGEHDAHQNEFAIRAGLRILSSYQVNETVIWIITEADRSSTTLLLPSEY